MNKSIEAKIWVRDYIYSLRDAGYDIPETKRVELETYITSLIEKALSTQLKDLRKDIKGRIRKDTDPLHSYMPEVHNSAFKDIIKIIDNI